MVCANLKQKKVIFSSCHIPQHLCTQNHHLRIQKHVKGLGLFLLCSDKLKWNFFAKMPTETQGTVPAKDNKHLMYIYICMHAFIYLFVCLFFKLFEHTRTHKGELLEVGKNKGPYGHGTNTTCSATLPLCCINYIKQLIHLLWGLSYTGPRGSLEPIPRNLGHKAGDTLDGVPTHRRGTITHYGQLENTI